jgi:hypothetical protein
VLITTIWALDAEVVVADAVLDAAVAPEPLVPVGPLPLDVPPEPAAEVPDTCCPTVRVTAATVPSNGAVKVARDRFCCATASCAFDEANAALSALICAAEAPDAWSEATLAWLAATAARAWAT